MSEPSGLTINDGTDLPQTFRDFIGRFPGIDAAQKALADAADAAGPLDERTRELVKLGICLGAGLESALKSHTRRALQAGATREEIEQAVVLGATTAGTPRTIMAWVWATEQLTREEREGEER